MSSLAASRKRNPGSRRRGPTIPVFFSTLLGGTSGGLGNQLVRAAGDAEMCHTPAVRCLSPSTYTGRRCKTDSARPVPGTYEASRSDRRNRQPAGHGRPRFEPGQVVVGEGPVRRTGLAARFSRSFPGLER